MIYSLKLVSDKVPLDHLSIYRLVRKTRSCSSVSQWEGDGTSSEQFHAGVNHKSLIVIPEQSPDSGVPAAESGGLSGVV